MKLKRLQSDIPLSVGKTIRMVMDEAYTELYREFLKLRSLCLKQAALLQQLTETLKRQQGGPPVRGEASAMPTSPIQCSQAEPGPLPALPELPVVPKKHTASLPEPPLVQICNPATHHGVISQSGASGSISNVLAGSLDRLRLDIAHPGTERQEVLKTGPFGPLHLPGNGEMVRSSGDSKQAGRCWGDDMTREMFRMPSGFGSFLDNEFLNQAGGMVLMSEVALQSQVCDFCHAVFPGHTTTRGDFLHHLHTHIN
uniref:Tbk1/Ikki binding domain-containing protein n=1 Tax=Esox lucius TaxID=8010 RepID=A0A3P8Z3U1_ESOLU